MTAVAAAGSTRAFWYLTRGTGVVALLLLTAVLLLGVIGVARVRSDRLPRFLVQGLHRNLTLLALAFVAVHVLTTIADGFAPIALTDAVLPFRSAYRPVWLGLGAVAFDLLLALTVTSLLRARIGLRAWRALHWLAYASWPVALLHSLGTGSDARVGWLVLLAAACTVLVAAAVAWRGLAEQGGGPLRPLAVGGAVLVPVAILVWYTGGPGAPGWAARAGTPATLLAGRAVSLPRLPYAGPLRGTIVRSRRDASGLVTVQVSAASGPERLGVWLRGAPLAGGGVRVRRSRLTLGTSAVPNLYVGPLRTLTGSRLSALVEDARGNRVAVTVRLRIDRTRGTVAGTLAARSSA